MKYYQISLDVEVTGVKNGIYQIEIDKPKMENDIVYQEFINFFSYKNSDIWQEQDKINLFNIPPIKAKLLKKAILTDIMGYTPSISFLKYVYSKKYIDIIKSFNLDQHSTFEIVIENVLEQYYMMFIKTIRLQEINYEKSKVITGYSVTNNVKYHDIKSSEEYRQFLGQNPLGRFEKISISKKHFGKDIIDIQASEKPFYSEKLIDFLLDCKIKGMQIAYSNSAELDFH